MLGTIRIPKNLRLLSERLPKSNYGPRMESKDKQIEEIKPIVTRESSTKLLLNVIEEEIDK